MDKTFGLRERKKGLLRIGLVDALIDQLNYHHFDEIKVTALCEIMNISEVTFFNYFNQKEELLQLYMLIWNFKREIQINKNGRKKGLPAISQIFEDIATTPNGVVILNTLMIYIAKAKSKTETLALSTCERWLISSSNTDLIPLELNQQFDIHLKEGIELGEISNQTDISNANLLLSSLFYGGALISHATGIPLKLHYDKSLQIIFHN